MPIPLVDGELHGIRVPSGTPDVLRDSLLKLATRAPQAFTVDPDRTTNLTLVVRGGTELVNGAWVEVPDVELDLAPNAMHRIERAPGAVAVIGGSDFDPAKTPICEVLTSATDIEGVADRRPAAGYGATGAPLRATLTLTAAEVLAATDWVSGTWPAFATAPSGKFIMPGSRLLVRSGAGTDGREYGELSFVAAFYGDTNPGNDDKFVAWALFEPIEGLGADNPAVAMPFPLSWWDEPGLRNPEDLDGAALRLALPDDPWVGIPASYTIVTPGDDYAVGDTITLTDGAVLTVLTISGGGGTGPVATVEVTTPSEDRTNIGAVPNQDSTSGAGTGFECSVATLDPDTVPVADLTFILDYTLEDV